MNTAAQNEIGTLLEMGGANPRGNRHDCPKCAGVRAVTHTAECFYCHRCGWRGNIITLQRELGVYRRLSSAEYRDHCLQRERANRAARGLYERVQRRRFGLLDELRGLNSLEACAHRAGLNYPATWGTLALCYDRREPIIRELDALENSSAKEAAAIFKENL